MLAKSMMVLGKFLTVVLLTSGVVHAESWNKPLYQNELSDNTTTPNIIFNVYRSIFSSLNKEDSLKHKQAVYLALNRLENGEVARWASNDGYHAGQASVMVTAMLSGRLCRRVYSVITLDTDQRSFEEWACYNNNTGTWNFTDK